MKYSAFALAALAATGMASAQSKEPKWVPLQQPQAPQAQTVERHVDPATAPLQVGQEAPLVIQETPQLQNAGDVLRQGTPIHLATDADMNSQENRVGDRIDLRVLDAVSLNGHTVIPVDTRGVGEVTLVRRKGMWGKSGRLEFRPLYIMLGGRQFRSPRIK